VLLVLTGTAFWLWPRPIPIDVESYVGFHDYKRGMPRDAVQAAFAELGYRMVPPAEFNYDFLVDFDVAQFQGRSVPRLVFRNGPVQAQVYVLAADRFAAPTESLQLAHGFHEIRVYTNDGYHYLIDVTGGELRRLVQHTI
jgi:hypothetical protein